MALADWLWLVRLILEILKGIADMSEEDRIAISTLRHDSEHLAARPKRKKKNSSTQTDPAVT